MSDGTLFKPEKDFSKEADKIIPEAEALAKVRFSSQFASTNGKTNIQQQDVQKGIDKVLVLEKQARQVSNNDVVERMHRIDHKYSHQISPPHHEH